MVFLRFPFNLFRFHFVFFCLLHTGYSFLFVSFRHCVYLGFWSVYVVLELPSTMAWHCALSHVFTVQDLHDDSLFLVTYLVTTELVSL